MKKTKIITMIMLITIILLFILQVTTSATINPDNYNPNKHTPDAVDVRKMTVLANPIIGTIKTIGIVVAVITMIILGFKYMTGSIEEKAEYKKSMIPYLIGAIFVVGITQLLGVLIKVISELE